MVVIYFEETSEIIVHDVLEYTFEDLMQEFVAAEEAGEEKQKVRTLQWANGVAMWISFFPNTSETLRDKLHGILHYEKVTYALMKEFQKRVIRGNVTINFIDESEVPVHSDLSEKLKKHSRFFESKFEPYKEPDKPLQQYESEPIS